MQRTLRSTSAPLALTALVAVLICAVSPTPAVAKKKPKDPNELFNPFLGPEYSQWLVGPIVLMATDDEVDRFLLLASDEEAAAFVEEFWAERTKDVPVFGKSPREIFEQRGVEADKRFSEGAFPGRKTDRGATLILYGEPETIEFESGRKVGDPTLEVWTYPKDAEKGLDGEKPDRTYRFVEVDDHTILYTGQTLRRDPRDEWKRRNTGWSG